MMKNFLLHTTMLIAALLAVSCNSCNTDAPDTSDSTSVVRSLYDKGHKLLSTEEEDSALAIMLTAVDYAQGCNDNELLYNVYRTMSRIYERKNVFELQEKYLRKILDSNKDYNNNIISDIRHQLGVSLFAQGKFNSSIEQLRNAITESCADSLSFRAQCLTMLGQVYLQTEQYDSVKYALDKAKSTYPSIANEELYLLTDIYLQQNLDSTSKAKEKILANLDTDNIYLKIELLNILMNIHEDEGNNVKAIEDAKMLLALNDSIREIEASTTTAKIHSIKHEEHLRYSAVEKEMIKSKATARIYLLLFILTAVIALATILILIFRKRVIAAHQAELEALRLAEDAQSSEAEIRALNEELQKRYYEHLYAIILPILNAKRTSSGHIDLNEKSWKLIEENTELVLPNFAQKLKRNHQSLTDEDMRFCCLVAMKVPNPIIANIYGIAPSSVAVRKQRMKKKLDECIANETLENYLNKYTL